MFMVLAVVEKRTVTFFGMKKDLELSWADGMVGVLPVFKTREEAVTYCNGKNIEIVEIAEVLSQPKEQS